MPIDTESSNRSSIFESFELGDMSREEYAKNLTTLGNGGDEYMGVVPNNDAKPAVEPAPTPTPKAKAPPAVQKPVSEMRPRELKKFLGEHDVDYHDAPDVAALREIAAALVLQLAELMAPSANPDLPDEQAGAAIIAPESAYGEEDAHDYSKTGAAIIAPESAYGGEDAHDYSKAIGGAKPDLPDEPTGAAGRHFRRLEKQAAIIAPESAYDGGNGATNVDGIQRSASGRQTELGAHAVYETLSGVAPPAKPTPMPKPTFPSKKISARATPRIISGSGKRYDSVSALDIAKGQAVQLALAGSGKINAMNMMGLVQYLTAKNVDYGAAKGIDDLRKLALTVEHGTAVDAKVETLEERREKARQQRKKRLEMVKKQKSEQAVAVAQAAQAEKKRKEEQTAALKRAGLLKANPGDKASSQTGVPSVMDDVVDGNSKARTQYNQNAAPAMDW